MARHFEGGSQKTVAKLVILEEYLNIYTSIMTSQWGGELWYVDTHAGTGKTLIDNADRLVPGSPIRAIENHEKDFDAFYFYEVDSENFTMLHETLETEFDLNFEVREAKPDDADFQVAKSESPKVVIMQMDSNEGASFLAEKSNQNRHWFTFVDPKGLTAKKSTIDTLTNRGNMDILINYQTTGVMRSAAAEHAHAAVTRTLGDDDWPEAGTPEEFVEEYKQRIETRSKYSAVTKAMESPQDRSWRFDLVFASINNTARELMKGRMKQERLWEKAAEETGQSGLNKWM